MAARQLHVGDTARHDMLRGIDALANTVKVTLGPHARHVLLEKNSAPHCHPTTERRLPRTLNSPILLPVWVHSWCGKWPRRPVTTLAMA